MTERPVDPWVLMECRNLLCSVRTFDGNPDNRTDRCCPSCWTPGDVVGHELKGQACSCGGWTAPLGTSIRREFDRHLLAVRGD